MQNISIAKRQMYHLCYLLSDVFNCAWLLEALLDRFSYNFNPPILNVPSNVDCGWLGAEEYLSIFDYTRNPRAKGCIGERRPPKDFEYGRVLGAIRDLSVRNSVVLNASVNVMELGRNLEKEIYYLDDILKTSKGSIDGVKGGTLIRLKLESSLGLSCLKDEKFDGCKEYISNTVDGMFKAYKTAINYPEMPNEIIRTAEQLYSIANNTYEVFFPYIMSLKPRTRTTIDMNDSVVELIGQQSDAR